MSSVVQVKSLPIVNLGYVRQQATTFDVRTFPIPVPENT
jgi:hypothetical protein